MPTSVEKYDAARRSVWNYPPMLYVTQTVSQNLNTSTSTLINFDTVVYDNYNGFSIAGSTYTVAVAGWYWLNTYVNYNANNTGVRIARALQNGVGGGILVSAMPTNTVGSLTITAMVSGPVQCAVGDTLVIHGFQSSGGVLGTHVGGGFFSSFMLEWLRLP